MHQAIRYLIILFTGMCLYGVLQGAFLAARGRVGILGGEILILPLLIGMIYMGWILCDLYRASKHNRIVEEEKQDESKRKM